MKLEIAYYGNPILRKKALPIDEITDEIRQLARDMIETMFHFNGIGLAAPQIKKPLRMFVTCLEKEEDDGEMTLNSGLVFINPVITNLSDAMVEAFEGCLSIPQLRGPVYRPVSLTVQAFDLDGNPFSLDCHGYKARLMLHENDHLNGVLYIDRMRGKKREELEPLLREVKKKYSK